MNIGEAAGPEIDDKCKSGCVLKNFSCRSLILFFSGSLQSFFAALETLVEYYFIFPIMSVPSGIGPSQSLMDAWTDARKDSKVFALKVAVEDESIMSPAGTLRCM